MSALEQQPNLEKLVTIIGVDSVGQKRVSVMEEAKRGSKYIHGRFVHLDEDGAVKANYWQGKEPIADITILKGARWEIVEQFRKYRVQVQDYETRKSEARQKSEYKARQEAYDKTNGEMKAWDAENPLPENPLDYVGLDS